MQKSLIALSLLGAANMAHADNCQHCYCLGPENTQSNAPVKPVTCNGDLFIEVTGFYWNAHQDGLEYAIDNHVKNPIEGGAVVGDLGDLNNLIDAQYKRPDFDWDFGLKFGIGYNSPCDGWDIGVLWTWYQTKARDHVEAEFDDNHSLLPLWSAFQSVTGTTLNATDIQTFWKLKLNLVDLELGRLFWTSPKLSIRPFVGIRIAYLDQTYEIEHRGGSFGFIENPFPLSLQFASNNTVRLKNDFKGAGLRSGLNTIWSLGCGWAIYGDFAISLVYGRFHVKHDENNRRASTPHTKTKLFDANESFRATRGMLDLGLGIQWSSLFCDCHYGLTVSLGYEEHLFLHQNQLWRVMRSGGDTTEFLPNLTGENIFKQSRGTLDTQGFTLSLKFEF